MKQADGGAEEGVRADEEPRAPLSLSHTHTLSLSLSLALSQNPAGWRAPNWPGRSS